MTARINDGGPAFPQLSVEAGERDGHGDMVEPFTASAGGLSARDWFAGQVLPTVVAEYANRNGGIGADHLPRNCAVHAYRIADAMLAEREKSGGSDA